MSRCDTLLGISSRMAVAALPGVRYEIKIVWAAKTKYK